MKKSTNNRIKGPDGFWDWFFAIIGIMALIGLGYLLFYGMCLDYSGSTKGAWIPGTAFAILVISIIIYDQTYPDGGLL